MTTARNLLIVVLSLLVFVSGCVGNSSEDATSYTTIPEKTETNRSNLISMEELSRHNSPSDCWMAIHGKVYDVTSYIPSHPGGDSIVQGCGKDATELFETRPMGSGTPHSDNARNMLKNFYIGDLAG